jgi:hypothetical protein
MGQRAQPVFSSHGIKVIVGAISDAPEKIVVVYLKDTLETGDNICDH